MSWRMVAVKDPVFPPAVPAGYTLYYLTYESEGKLVQAVLGVPVGKGPFQLLVDLHGGSQVALSGPSRTWGVTAAYRRRRRTQASLGPVYGTPRVIDQRSGRDERRG